MSANAVPTRPTLPPRMAGAQVGTLGRQPFAAIVIVTFYSCWQRVRACGTLSRRRAETRAWRSGSGVNRGSMATESRFYLRQKPLQTALPPAEHLLLIAPLLFSSGNASAVHFVVQGDSQP